MNLVQINERLKDLPSQVIQQYANGMNPEVPPYLALAEMQRRETAQKQMATAQGAAQGPQPSVKEQMEQKAGLMAAQALQQQQMQQQMQQPRGPMPVPAGVPQPQMQPQAPQETMMAARGGLAHAPVNFDFQHGGIVAFQSGGRAPRIQDEVPLSDEERERLQRELLMRLVGEATRNPPERRQPMQITESDTSTVPGLESGDLMARALAETRGPQPDNRGMINRIEARDARHAAMLEREREKSANRPKYETPYDRLNRENRGELTEEEQKKRTMIESLISQIPRDKNIVQGGERVEGSELERNIRNTAMALPGASASRALSGSLGAGRGVAAGLAAMPDRSEQAPEAPRAGTTPEASRAVAAPMQDNRRLLNQADAAMRAAPAGPAGAPIADLKALADQQRRQQAPRPAPVPAPAPAAAPAQPAPESMDAMLRAQLADQPKIRTMEDALAEQKAAREGAGMTAPAGQDQMARIKALQAQYESSKPSALDDMIRVFGQAGQYKGLSGTGPAYTANQAQKRAQDLNMAQKINELMSGVETTQRGEMKDVATGALAGLGVDRAAQEAFRKEKLQALSSGRTADVQAESTRRGQDIQLQIGKMQAAATREAREQGLGLKEIQAAEAAFARDPEAAAIKKKLENPIFANNPAKTAADLQRLREIQASKYKQFGATLEGAPGAASPGGTTRMRFDAQGNPIK